MSKTNCVNCGSAKDTSEIKCPFCGTTYLDFTAIDFGSGDPVICQFVMPKEIRYGDTNKRVVMSMKAIPMLEEMVMTTSRLDITSLDDRMHSYLSSPPEMNVGISFRPVCGKNNELFSIRPLQE